MVGSHRIIDRLNQNVNETLSEMESPNIGNVTLASKLV